MKRLVRQAYRRIIWCVFVLLSLCRSGARGEVELGTALHPRRILVLRLGLLGDGALLTPALRRLHDAYPDAEIDVLATPIQAPLFEPLPSVERVHVWTAGDLLEPRRALRVGAWRAAAATVRALRERRFDLAISCYGALGSAIALLSGAPVRIGYAGEALPGTLTHTLPGGRFDRPWHAAQYNLAVVEAALPPLPVGEATLPQIQLAIAPEARLAVDVMLRAAGVAGDARLVVLLPGATNGAAKRWPVVYWAELVRRLRADGVPTVLAGGPEERDLVAEIRACGARDAVDLTGKTSVPELLATLERAGVVVSGDSGPMHLAVGLGRPTVAIHGPTDPRIDGPYNLSKATVVRHHLACSPCYRLDAVADCPLGHTLCQWLNTPDTVYRAVRAWLTGAGETGAITQAERDAGSGLSRSFAWQFPDVRLDP
ncbi:MAG: lipopolysaccharide heptosyltransferase II [Chloroflexi bacterium]|nr:lipopolysaccharide heptosyltransferase II [Chloroflexota bacterium]